MLIKKTVGKNAAYFPISNTFGNVHSIQHIVEGDDANPVSLPYLVIKFNSESEHLRPAHIPALRTKTVQKSDTILNHEGVPVAIKPEKIYTLVEMVPMREKDQISFTDPGQIEAILTYLNANLAVTLPDPVVRELDLPPVESTETQPEA